jgi:DNA phosphorothioation-dependent restriction protein DptG
MKKNMRSKAKYPALNKKLNIKVRQELIDYDYLEKLSDDDKKWLNKFTEEYVNASFKKTEGGNYSSKNLHRKKVQRKDCYDRNNKRNVDIFSIKKSSDMLKDSESLVAALEDKSYKSASLSRGQCYCSH